MATGMTKDVTFEQVSGAVNDRFDEAYRTKYSTSLYLNPMIGQVARAATLKVLPHEKKTPA